MAIAEINNSFLKNSRTTALTGKKCLDYTGPRILQNHLNKTIRMRVAVELHSHGPLSKILEGAHHEYTLFS